MTALAWVLEVDWDKDGDYTTESGRVISGGSLRGRERMFEGERDVFLLDESKKLRGPKPVDVGYVQLVLDNYDNRYDPYNAGGDLYGYLLPGRPMRLKVSDGGTSMHVLTGYVMDVRPQGGSQMAVMRCVEGLEFLGRQNCDANALQSDYLVSDAIYDLAEMATFPFVTSGSVFPFNFPGTIGSSTIENNGDTLEYWWTDPQETILAAMNELARAWWGTVFVTREGAIAYRSRAAGRAATITLTQGMLGKEIQTDMPWEEICNLERAVAWPRKVTDSGIELWRLSNRPMIEAGDTLTIWAEFTYEGERCPATDITTPVATTDYKANTQENDGGVDKTAQISINITKYAMTAKLEITNNDAGSVYLTLMKLRGSALVAPNWTTVEVEDATSQTAFGKSVLEVDSLWIQTTAHANNLASYVGIFGPEVKRCLKVRLVDRFDVQFGLELFDTVNVEIGALGIDGKYQVAQIGHEWWGAGPAETVLRLEPDASEYAGLGVFTFVFEVSSIIGW